MRWQGRRTSSNVVRNAGGARGAAGGGIIFILLRMIVGRFGIRGVIAIVVVLGLLWVSGIFNPTTLLQGGTPGAQTAQTSNPCDGNETDRFLCTVLASTEDVWNPEFQKRGAKYPEPQLVLFTGSVNAGGCGVGQSAMGPFYCPATNALYLDTSFFKQMEGKMNAGGDFAYAYVVAHEVGHHIQNVTGTLDQAHALKLKTDKAGQNAVQVRVELQADCYAGVWGSFERNNLEDGDIEEALNAAKAVGDDTLQRSAGRTPVPETFSHGSAEQRMRWFKRGFDTGKMESCDTFNAARL